MSTGKQSNFAHHPAPGVIRLRHLIVNSYLVGDPGSPTWAVVDAGLSNMCGARIIHEAEKQFGRGAKPAGIILTHGHFDHVGGLQPMIDHWNVPVYAHSLVLPYLTGVSAYPPPDPTVGGGLMARMAGLFPRTPIDLGGGVEPLPEDGLLPGLPGWRWLHTPGHSPGHVSLWRMLDSTLIAGDAFVTLKQESLLGVLSEYRHVRRPPAYFTPDWESARRSVKALASLEPEVAATGHGIPMRGPKLRRQLHELAAEFDRAMPRHGRYVPQPAVMTAAGVISTPPPVRDPLPKIVGVSLASLTVLALVASVRHKRRALLHG